MVAPALLEVNRRTGARLQLLGAPRGHLGSLENMTDRIPWSECSMADLIGTWDVGLMPLADRLYERGKCAYKLLQYAAAGLPSVTSPVGVNREIADALNFSAARTVDEWFDAIMDSILSAPANREIVGRRARTQVERRYSYDAWASAWLAAIGEPASQATPSDSIRPGMSSAHLDHLR